MSLKIIQVSLVHDDFSQLTQMYDSLKVTTLYSVPSFSNNIINGIVYVEASNKNEYKAFINRVKEHGRVKNIEPIQFYFRRDKLIAVLKTITQLKDSITEYMILNNVYMYNELMSNGKEYWTIITDLRPSKIISELSERTDDISLVSNLDVNNVLLNIIKTGLTKREREVLWVAYEMGYFNQPRNVKAGLIAERLGVSKVTLLHELRNIIRKLVIRELLTGKFKRLP